VHKSFDEHEISRVADGTQRGHNPVTRWLAARLFGAWAAYQADGLAATLASLRACLDTFDAEIDADGDPLQAIRRSDWRLLHRGGPENPAYTRNLNR
jgi:hypothetical protein